MIAYDKSKDLIVESIRLAKYNANEARKREVAKRIDIYKDNLKTYIEDEIKKQFSKYTNEGIKQMVDDSQNITKRIINEISTIYAVEPKRTAFVDEKIDINYDALINRMSTFNLILDEVNKYTNLCNHAIVYIAPNLTKKKLTLSTKL